MIDTIFTFKDQRVIDSFPDGIPGQLHSVIPVPLDQPHSNYHIWDWQFVQNDVLQLLPKLIEITSPSGVPEENHQENTVIIYPNPSNGNVHLSMHNQKIKCIRLYNSLGELIEEFFKNDFSVSNLTAGIYYIYTQTDKSTFTNKLIKQ